jgi:HlyD family secretion protein
MFGGNTGRGIVIVALLAALAGAGWWLATQRGASDAAAPETVSVVRRDFASTVLATGVVNPQVGAEVKVGARTSGRVERLFANIGDVVRRGQVIAELERADLEATVGQREAELALAEAKLSAVQNIGPREIERAEAHVVQWEATLALESKELLRQDLLLEHGITSQQARDQVQERVSVAEAQLVSARKALELVQTQYSENLRQADTEVLRAGAALQNARVHLSYATVTAPIEGVVGSVSTQEGETVAAGLNAPTFVTVINLDRLQVDAFVDEVDIGKVRSGQRAVFTVDSFPAEEFEGEVVAIHPQAVIQDNVVNYDVVIEIVSPYHDLLRPQMTAAVTIFLEARSGVLAVPARAIRRERGRNLVYLEVNGRAEPREVRTGWRDGQWVEIVDGLEQGEIIVLDLP